MRLFLFVIVFLLLGAFFIISNNNFHVGNPEQFDAFMTQYYDWFFKLGKNVKTATAYVVNIDWMP